MDHNIETPGILEESRELRSKSEVNIARFLVIPRDGLTLVRVANVLERPIRLLADLPIAQYHPVRSGDGCVVPMEPDPDPTNVS